MTDRVKSIAVYTITLPRDTPYLGALRPGEEPNERGYIVRKGNRTVYPTVDRSVVVRIETARSEEHTSELQSLMRISYAVFCLKKKKKQNQNKNDTSHSTN